MPRMPNKHTKGEQVITVPNEMILTNATMNYSRLGNIYSDSIVMSISYESNWRKAIQILEKVAEEGSKKFIVNEAAIAKAEKKSWKEAIALLQEASTKLRKGFLKKKTKEDIYGIAPAATVTENACRPNVSMSLGASSIDLEVIYQANLRSLRATKNEITRRFAEEVEKQNDIEFAYPHMQLVYDEKPKARNNSRLNKWIEKKE